jgi:hypothetical protein
MQKQGKLSNPGITEIAQAMQYSELDGPHVLMRISAHHFLLPPVT